MEQNADPAGSGARSGGGSGYGEIVDLLLRQGLVEIDQVRYAVRICAKLSGQRSLLDVLKELGAVTDRQVRETIRGNLQQVKIGGLLVELGVISDKDLQVGLALQAGETPRRKLGEVLVAHHLVDQQALIEALSMKLGFPRVDLEFTELDAQLASRVPHGICLQYHFVPVRSEQDGVLVAFADPLDLYAVRIAQQHLGSRVFAGIAAMAAIHQVLEKLAPNKAARRIDSVQEQGPVKVLNEIFASALHSGNVSDIHLEPLKDRYRIRFRQDGVLQHYGDIGHDLAAGVISRIKVMCGADITEKRRHQGGRLAYEHQGAAVDTRVSTYVTVNGEKIVLRLLNRKNELFKIGDIGMTPRMLARFREEALDRPSGVVLITGPTGSGKTSTVYSCIQYLDNAQTSIITAEEPVEYLIDGIAQCSINPRINLTFEETLRHIVRQDPDVIVIGEIRDTYSAGVAVQAALTGHKVLTTFHTEDSIGGLIRLLNMEIDAFLISSTVVCVVAQRLLRRICSECAVSYTPTAQDYLRLGCTPNEVVGATFKQGRGCSACRHTGYRGRVAAFEMLVLNEAVRDAILEKRTSHQIRQLSLASTGLVMLVEDGIIKAAAGETTIDEVLRVLPRLQKPRPLDEIRRLSGLV